MKTPKTLKAAIEFFANPVNCIEYLCAVRWADGKPICPVCGRNDATFIPSRQKFQCKARHAQRQFSAKVGTIFEDSPISLDKWLLAVWMVINCKNGVSSYEIHRDIGVTQKTAWFMLHRIRLAMQGDVVDTFGGEVEVDETYIGGLGRNMHKSKRAAKFHGRTGGAGKTAVFGLLERSAEKGKSKIRARVIPETWKNEAREIIREVVERGSNVYTDEHGAYHTLGSEGFNHAFVRHAEYYVDGAVHTNGIENFWALLKRGIKGTYVSVEPFHMFRYLDEQAFRFNERFGNDGDRFETVMKQIVGKRLMYKELTGKTQETTTSATPEVF
jgi:transposase-like protein